MTTVYAVRNKSNNSDDNITQQLVIIQNANKPIKTNSNRQSSTNNQFKWNDAAYPPVD